MPAFDYFDNKGKAYLKIKSDDFIFAKSALVETTNDSSVVIVPTDDPNLKMVIIPQDCLTQQSTSQTQLESILATLASLQVNENTEKKQLFLPSFDLKVDSNVPELEGLRLSETHRIKEAKYHTSVELVHAKAQEEGLI